MWDSTKRVQLQLEILKINLSSHHIKGIIFFREGSRKFHKFMEHLKKDQDVGGLFVTTIYFMKVHKSLFTWRFNKIHFRCKLSNIRIKKGTKLNLEKLLLNKILLLLYTKNLLQINCLLEP